MSLDQEQVSQLREKLDNRQKLDAIKLYREWTRCSLMEAKKFVEQFASDESIALGEAVAEKKLQSLSDDQMDQILDALTEGNKLAAIKHYRSFTGSTLMDSRTFIESLMEELGVESPSGSGCAGVVLLIAGTIAATAATWC